MSSRPTNDAQSFLTGNLLGVMMKAKSDYLNGDGGFLRIVDVCPIMDGADYTNTFTVTLESGTTLTVSVHEVTGVQTIALGATTDRPEPNVKEDTSMQSTDTTTDARGAVAPVSKSADPKSLLVCGDWHGDPSHALYCFQEALDHSADAIFQVGDFGYWEHMPGGKEFLDALSDLATSNDIPLYWIDGNHESHTLLRLLYGPGGKYHKLTTEGFWTIRPGVFYVPRGTRWAWQGKHLMGLGGAYSVDKQYRLARETGVPCPEWGWTWQHARANPPTGPHTMWWPEEELTDEDVATALADLTPLDVLFTHDKPRSSNPGWNRKDRSECWPNQDKIQTVVHALTPKLLIHGHLHFPYQQEIRCVADQFTQVVSLNCNPDDPKMPEAQKVTQRRESWVLLTL